MAAFHHPFLPQPLDQGQEHLLQLFILFGYLCGISAKLIEHNHNLAFYFYILNITMVTIDICLYFRNRKLEKQSA